MAAKAAREAELAARPQAVDRLFDVPPQPPSQPRTPTVGPSPRRRPVADEDLFADAGESVRPELAGLMRMSLARSR
jgi:hypothetical protein